jgi:hypothetical protein
LVIVEPPSLIHNISIVIGIILGVNRSGCVTLSTAVIVAYLCAEVMIESIILKFPVVVTLVRWTVFEVEFLSLLHRGIPVTYNLSLGRDTATYKQRNASSLLVLERMSPASTKALLMLEP